MAKLTKVFLDFEAGTAKFNAPIKRAQRNLKSFGGTAGRAKRAFANLKGQFLGLVAPLLAVGTAIAAVRSSLQNFRAFEVLAAQLKVATGSAKQGKIEFANLTELAKTMPGTLQELTGSFIKLKNFGLDASNESLISFANTAAATGKSLDQFVEAVADAATREFERLKEFGIITRNQGETIAFTFRGITRTVKNNSAAIQGFLKGIGETEFAGAIAEQLDTLDTKLSNFSDAWAVFTATIAEGGLGSAAKGFLTGLSDELNAATLALKIGKLKELDDIELKLVGLEDLGTLKSYRATLDATVESAKELGSAFFSGLQGTGSFSSSVDEAFKPRAKLIDERVRMLFFEKQAQKPIQDGLDLFLANDKTRSQILSGRLSLQKAMTIEGNKDLTGQLKIKMLNEAIVEQWKTISDIRRDMISGVDEKEQAKLATQFEKSHDRIRQMRESIKSTKDELGKASQAAIRFNQSFSEGLARGIVLGHTLGDVIANIVQQLAITGLTNIFTGLIDGGGSGGLGGFVSKIFGGPRAEGGPVSPGKAYLVGERGRELFSPGQAGTISPLSNRGGSITFEVTNNFDIHGGGEDVQRQIAESVAASVSLSILQIQNLKNRGVIV